MPSKKIEKTYCNQIIIYHKRKHHFKKIYITKFYYLKSIILSIHPKKLVCAGNLWIKHTQ